MIVYLKVDCSLYTCNSVEERREGNTHTRSLASLGGVGQWAHDVRVNGPLKSDPKPHKFVAFFCHLFFSMSLCLIWDVVTLGRSSL
jgi:hypothetical protein